ncbi:MAG: hemerythrin domain-containing protein [Bacteroidetes bacterium]|nr:MAG: hemerythrin domain-containing protein [Bacteroidota bacterium]
MNKPIKRHPSLVNLSRDHYSGLLLSSVLKKDTPDFKNMPVSPGDKVVFVKDKYVTELRGHFLTEEEILFPFVSGRKAEIDQLIKELILEHRELELRINSLEGVADLVNALNETGYLLESHIRKEERQLFQMIQESFTESELLTLEKKLSGK